MTRRLLAVAFILLLTVPLFAQKTVSRIEVRGNVPARLVVSQTALVEGRAYSERDLEIAVARIRRLPFVYDARYSMDGETLIIDVDSMTRFFADLDASGSGDFNRGSGFAGIGGGARFFVGDGGVAQATVKKMLAQGGDGRFLGAEYAHYGIAGTRFFASAGIGTSVVNEEGFEPDPTWHATIGYPLTVRQTLTATVAGDGFVSERNVSVVARPLVSSSTERTLNLRWTYDTSDDPFFARRGEVISASPSRTSAEWQSEGLTIFGPGGTAQIHTTRREGTINALHVDAAKYWALGERNVLFSTLNASAEQNNLNLVRNGVSVEPLDGETNSVSLTVGLARNLFDWGAPLSSARHRVEVGLRASRRDLENGYFGSNGVMAGWTLRRQYMNVKLNLSYDFD